MLDVRSEVGRLREVLVHAPGPEVDRMVPDMMEELLFDDILFGERAREEHERFRRCSEFGRRPKAHDMRDLLVEALAAEGARSWLLDAMLDDVSSPVGERMQTASPSDLVDMFVTGVRWTEGSDVLSSEELFEVVPVPNWCFQRDPQVVVADSVLFSAMATLTRTREVLLARTVFRFHPDSRGHPCPARPAGGLPRPSPVHRDAPTADRGWGRHGAVEGRGGDRVLRADESLGRAPRGAALTRMEYGPRWLIVASLPQKRAYMHLDTVMTQIDEGRCLAFPPVILPGHDDTASVYEFDLHEKDPRPRPAADMLTALRGRGVDLEAIPCGGATPSSNSASSGPTGPMRWRWRPGVIVLYERNVATAECLAGRGYRVVEADDVIAGRVPVDLDRPEPTCILLPSHELSRARGGPHCLSHALRRDPVR